MSVHYSSNSNEWETPQELFDELSDKFGRFTLDPCCTIENKKCAKFYTQADDGLSKTWIGENVFMNPPYGKVIGSWIAKAFYESEQEETQVVCLIPARTDTKYWHHYVMRAAKVFLIRGRLRFSNAKNTAPFPSAIVIFNGNNGNPEFESWI